MDSPPPVSLSRRRFFQRALQAGAVVCFGMPLMGMGQVVHVVRRGDTLSAIALANGVTVRDLKRANGLRGDLIRVGQRLTIPSADGSPALEPVQEATRRLQIAPDRWRFVVAHHSAIEAGNAAIYDSGHRRRGMKHGLAYHFVIGCGRDSGDGEIEIGHRWHEQLRGGHVRSSRVNDAGIGICLVGNLQNRAPTPRQQASFIQLVEFLKSTAVAPNAGFTVHKWVDRNHTVCPGRHFPYSAMKQRFA